MALQSSSLADPAADRGPAVLGWPGVRAFRSARFRLVLATALWLVGVVILGAVLLRQAVNPAGQYAFDFQTYDNAAGEIATGHSPYAASMFVGPIPAQAEGAQLYKYPPLLAQLLVPLTQLPLGVAAGAWLVAQSVAVFGATWLAARAGGAARASETFAWSAAATTFFLPAFDTLWKGNISGFLALAVAIALAGGLAGGAGSMASTLLKSTPAVMLVPVAVAGRRALLGAALCVPVLLGSFVLSPGAWFDFARVIPNLLAGPSLYPNNLALHSLANFGLPGLPAAAEVARVTAVVLAAVAVAMAIWLARRDGGWPAALTLAVAASLLLPTATWYHYLCVLLPPAAFAWPRAGGRGRAGLACGGALVTAGLAALPLSVLGAALMTISSVFALWPREKRTGGAPSAVPA